MSDLENKESFEKMMKDYLKSYPWKKLMKIYQKLNSLKEKDLEKMEVEELWDILYEISSYPANFMSKYTNIPAQIHQHRFLAELGKILEDGSKKEGKVSEFSQLKDYKNEIFTKLFEELVEKTNKKVIETYREILEKKTDVLLQSFFISVPQYLFCPEFENIYSPNEFNRKLQIVYQTIERKIEKKIKEKLGEYGKFLIVESFKVTGTGRR